ncbi:hypothetical protein K4G22_07950 [Streptomyces profundus]|nr:hypothetical protein K4G22_07950 [Streptomyces sp. MA3_2.13]
MTARANALGQTVRFTRDSPGRVVEVREASSATTSGVGTSFRLMSISRGPDWINVLICSIGELSRTAETRGMRPGADRVAPRGRGLVASQV